MTTSSLVAYREIASICSMRNKSPQLTQDFLDDFAATDENLHHKLSPVRYFPKPPLKIYKFILSFSIKPKNKTFVGPHRGGILS